MNAPYHKKATYCERAQYVHRWITGCLKEYFCGNRDFSI